MLGETAAAFVISAMVSKVAASLNESFLSSPGLKGINLNAESGSAPALYLVITIIAFMSWVLVMYEVGKDEDRTLIDK